MLYKRLSITLFVVLSILLGSSSVYAAEVFLGGDSIGIELNYDGVVISGTYDISIDNKSYNPSSDGFVSGDLIKKVNDKTVKSISNLMKFIESDIEKQKPIFLTIQRDGRIFTQELKIQHNQKQFSTGLYVQDGLSGIGTMTYYNPSNQQFGALGHIMYDSKLSNDIPLNHGKVYNSYIKKIRPSENEQPGEKVGEIGSIDIGTVFENNNFGIYGSYIDSQITNKETISTASMDEVKKGDAYFLTVLNGHEIQKCHIKITHLKKQKQPDVKGITFEVVDKDVLKQAHGIVQGMSGSPIIQNGKLIGCVTHVNVNNAKIGYGLYIDWMLQNNN